MRCSVSVAIGAFALGQIVKAPAHVAPAKGQRYGSFGRLGPGEFLVGLRIHRTAGYRGSHRAACWRGYVPGRARNCKPPRAVGCRPMGDRHAQSPRSSPAWSARGLDRAPARRSRRRRSVSRPASSRAAAPPLGRLRPRRTPSRTTGWTARGSRPAAPGSAPGDTAADDRHSVPPAHGRPVASVGMPPSISRAGAGACTTVPVQARQASFGRLVTITRNCAGITSSRSEVSSPITVMRRPAARARGVLGRQRHLDPRQVRRQCASAGTPLGGIVRRSSGSRFSASASSLAIACSRASKPSCSCSSGRRSERGPKCMRLSCSSR